MRYWDRFACWFAGILFFVEHVHASEGFQVLVDAFGGQSWLAIAVLIGAVLLVLILLLAAILHCRSRPREDPASPLYVPPSARVYQQPVQNQQLPYMNGPPGNDPHSSLRTASLQRNASIGRQSFITSNKYLSKEETPTPEILKSEKLYRKNNAYSTGITNTSNYNNSSLMPPSVEFRVSAEEEARNESPNGIASGTGQPSQSSAPGPGGATTLINQGETIALPGFLKMDYTNDVRVLDKIAEGGGGVVYTAELLNSEMIFKHGRQKVIVKTLKQLDSFSKDEFLSLFRQEVTAMWALHHHKNVVSLIGFSEDPFTIVLKRYERSLFDAVLDRRLEISAESALYFAFCIADGMTEMHNMGMIHRDLKSANILVDLDPNRPIQVVISDFGLVRVAKSSEVSGQKLTTAMGISYRYASPEAFDRLKTRTIPDAEEDKASDVYAFAIIGWELMERKVPWGRLKNEEIQNLVCSNVRLDISAHFRTGYKLWQVIIKLIEACWAHKRHARPKFRDVHDKLKPFKDYFRPNNLRINPGTVYHQREPSRNGR